MDVETPYSWGARPMDTGLPCPWGRIPHGHGKPMSMGIIPRGHGDLCPALQTLQSQDPTVGGIGVKVQFAWI